MSLQSFLDSLKKYISNGFIALGTLLKQVETSYPFINVSDRNFLVKECLKDRTKIDYALFEDLLSKFSKSLKPSVTNFF